ncbi:hypothetical protein C0993_002736 [Termitomyces sp. T159_Od127]|nr:hypothetical protein C0993_002736 [Termitomyces sp. T159_Od127]
MWGTLEVGLPLLEGFDNGKELFVVDVVVELHRDHQAGVEGNGLELITAKVYLQDYTSDGIVRGVAFKDNREGGVKMVEDGGGGEGFFEEGEYALALAVPVPRSVLSCEPVERFSEPGVIINELAVKVGKTKEGLHLFYALGQRPVEDGLHLSGVHANAIWVNYDAEVLWFSVAEANLGVDFGAAEAVNKITNEGKWIQVLFGDFVEALVVNAKVQGTIFLFGK